MLNARLEIALRILAVWLANPRWRYDVSDLDDALRVADDLIRREEATRNR